MATSVENMEDYEVIFIGYPIWWSDMPMAIYTFPESYDFSGKTIIPFCTHKGRGISSTESSIAEVCSDAEILEGLEIRGSIVQNFQDEANEMVTGWLDEIEHLGQEQELNDGKEIIDCILFHRCTPFIDISLNIVYNNN